MAGGPTTARVALLVVIACEVAASSRALCRHPIEHRQTFRQRPQIAACAPSRAPSAESAKKELLEAIARLRRLSPIDYEEGKAELLRKLAALEAIPSARDKIDGRWSLIYSTNAPPLGSSMRASAADPLQEAIAAAYKVFFKFAPALAGGQDASFLSASNEQRVDVARGVVDNYVSIPLPGAERRSNGATVRLRVRGLVEPDTGAASDDDGCAFVITFTESQIDAPFIGASLTVPLPRPRGTITSTFSDGRFRVARGGRGTLFVLQRLGDSAQELEDADDSDDGVRVDAHSL